MLRHVATLLAALALSLAFADSLVVGRGVNLAQIDASCLQVGVIGDDPTLATAKASIAAEVAAEAAQDGIPLRANFMPHSRLELHLSGRSCS